MDSRLSISLKEVTTATDDFAEHRCIGKGGEGSVFRGVSTEGVEWAVKRLDSKNTLLKYYEREVRSHCRKWS